MLLLGLRQQAVAPDTSGTVRVSEVIAAVLGELGVPDARPGSRQYTQALETSPYSEIPGAVREGVLIGERYLCLWRETDSQGTSLIRLLRRGRHALVRDPLLYLRD